MVQAAELKWLMLNKLNKWFHSSRVKFPLVRMSASWFLVSMYLIWILESRLTRSNNQSKATLWVLNKCLIVGLLSLIIILITASLSSNTYTKASWRADWTFEGTESMSFITSIFLWDLWRLSTSLSNCPDPSETRETFPRTETIKSHSSRQSKPSNLNPMSKKIISHAASREPCYCHSVLLRPILKFWSAGVTLMKFTWREILSWISYDGWASAHLSSSVKLMKLRRLHILKNTTQMLCIRWSTTNKSSFQLMIDRCHDSYQLGPRSLVIFVTVDNKQPCIFVPIVVLQHGYCTFVIILFGPFTWLIINLTMCIRTLFTKSATTLYLEEHAFWRVPCFTKLMQVPLRSSLQGHRHILPLGLFPLVLRVVDACRSFCCMKEFGDVFDCVIFPRLLISWRKLQLSPFTHCPLVSHCQQSPRILCTRCFVPWFMTTAFFSKISISGAKILISNFLLDTSLHHSFQPVIIRS